MISDSKRIPWARLVLEGIVVVASILLAFAIDAWWEGRDEDARREALLIGLAADFERADEDLERVIGKHQRALEASGRLIGLARAGDPARDLRPRVDSLLSDVLLSGSFDPPTGTVDALIASGDVGTLRDPVLVAELNEWSAWAIDLLRMEGRDWEFVQTQLLPYLRRRIRTADLVWSPEYEGLSLPWAPANTDAYTLLSDIEFEGLVSDRWFNADEIVEWAQRTREIQQRIQTLLGEALAGRE